MEIDEAAGAFLVTTARKTVEGLFTNGHLVSPPREYPSIFDTNVGVFVTINKANGAEKELRGCIGTPYPDKPLIEALVRAAAASATEDPRFPPVSKDELPKVVFEVSVLTPPEQIIASPRELPQRIKVGSDGLIVKWAYGSGLLLPQVPVEYGWDAEEFLGSACMKAGATPDIWLVPSTKVYKFSAIVFEEVEPRGKVVRKLV